MSPAVFAWEEIVALETSFVVYVLIPKQTGTVNVAAGSNLG